MSVLIKNMEMPKGCIYANDNDQTEYCPLLNHDDVPFCQYIESEPEIAIGIDERPVYCPLSDVPEPCENTVSRQAAIDAIDVKNVHKGIISALQSIIEELPSAQTEIIYCKDCKHRYVDGENVRFNVCELNHNKVQSDDWFCADAERKEGEADD